MVSAELRSRFFEALDREDGNVSGAARAVGVSPGTGYGWARKAGVRGRGRRGVGAHPARAEYEGLRAAGVGQRAAAAQVGVHERTARDWDRGVRKSNGARLYPDGRKIDYRTGVTTFVPLAAVPLAAIEAELHTRFLTLTERELIADMHRGGESLRAIGRALGRPASTVKRELDTRSVEGVYRPHRAQRHWAKSRPRRATTGGRRCVAHRAHPPQAAPSPRSAHTAVCGGDGDDLRAPSAGRGPRRAGPLGR